MAVYTKSKTRVNTYSVYDASTCSVQSKPIDFKKVLPYGRYNFKNVGYPNAAWHTSPASSMISNMRGSDAGYAQAYERLFSNLSGSKRAMLGVTLSQGRQALQMISKRARSVALILNQLQTLGERGSYAALTRLIMTGEGLGSNKVNSYKQKRQRSKRRGQSFKRDSANAWLELQFGIIPLLQDVYDSCVVLSSTPEPEKCSGTGFYSGSNIHYRTFPRGFERSDATGTKRLTLGGKVVGFNPNVLLLKQLGLTNPAIVAWDLVPWSFVIDWFLPVGRYLKSFDASLGFDLGFTYKSQLLNATGGDQYFSRRTDGTTERNEYHTSNAMEFTRTPWRPERPTFSSYVQPLSGSLWRAVTSVALVTQLKR